MLSIPRHTIPKNVRNIRFEIKGIPRKRGRYVSVVPKAQTYSIFPAVISSAIAFTTCYPLDTYKTRIQTDNKTNSSLYHGYKISLLLCCTITCIYFGWYRFFISMMSLQHATICASFATTCFKVPCKCVSKLLQNGSFDTFKDVFDFIMGHYGLMGFYRSFWLYVLDDVPETVLKFYLFSQIKMLFPENMALVGFITGMLTTIVTQPMDVLKTIMICNTTEIKIDLAKIDYTKGIWFVILINAIQSSIFLHVYHFLKLNFTL